MPWFKRLRGLLLQLVAGVLILLALLVGAARLALLEAPRFADDVRRIARDASGFELDFDALSAGLSVYGPELRLTAVQVAWPDGASVLAAGEVAVAVDLRALLTSGKFRPARIFVEDSSLDVRVAASGDILVQGVPLQDYLPAEQTNDEVPDILISVDNFAVTFADERRGVEPVAARIESLTAAVAAGVADIQLDLEPDPTLGRRLEVEGRVPLALLRDTRAYAGNAAWRLRARAQDFRLDPWLRLIDVTDAPIIGTDGTAEVAVEFMGLQPVSVLAELDVERVVLMQPASAPVNYERLSGKVTWQRDEQGWRATGDDLVVVRDGSAWPRESFTLDYQELEEGRVELAANIGFLRLQDGLPVARAFAGELLRERGLSGELRGDVSAVQAKLSLRQDEIGDFSVAAEFVDLGYADPQRAIVVAGFGGSLSTTRQSGQLTLRAEPADVYLGNLFRESWVISSFNGLAVWRENADGYRLIANDLKVVTPEGRGSASLELQTDLAFTDPVIDLTAVASMDDTNQAVKYLPRVIPDKVVTWLYDALQGGQASAAEFRLQGPLMKFPFRDDEGQFRIAVDFAEGGLDYAPGWPGVREARGRLIFDNESVYSTENDFLLGQQRVQNAQLMIADLNQGVVELTGAGPVDLAKLMNFMQNSPLGEKLGPVFADVRARGQATASAELVLPMRDLGAWQLEGELELRTGSAWLTTIEPRFTALAGTVKFSDSWLSSRELTAELLGEAVDINIEHDVREIADWSHRAVVTGNIPYAKAQQALGLPALGKLSGRTDFVATALFPALRPAAQPFRLQLSSDLIGIESRIPYPLNKVAAEPEELQAEVRFPGERIELALELGRGVLAQLEFQARDSGWRLRRGAVGLNAPPPAFVGADGLIVAGITDRLDLGAWTAAFAEPEPAVGLPVASAVGAKAQQADRWQDYFDRIDLDIGALDALGYRFPDVELGAGFGADAWQIALSGPQLNGRIRVPYAFTANERIDFEMQRLALVDSVSDGSTGATEDNPYSPLELPGIRGTAADFVLGNLNLGRLDADIARTSQGLESVQLTTRAPTFNLQVTGDWLVIDSAQRSRLRVEMNSTDMEQTLLSLGYSPLVDAKEGRLVADLLWEGGPGDALLYASTGAVEFAIKDGEVKDIDPGTGRILGLLSITSLPRRLALDFRDMTDEGLVFDSLQGRFRLDFGDAWTCNLSLEGEVADMAIVGRTGIRREDYDQVAIVRPHVSNLIPVSAAFLGGPTVGIATLLVAQIFKKPLSGIGESYYTVQGKWSDPDIRKAQRGELDTSAFGDCESQLPRLSPEEISAIEDLINSANDGQSGTNTAESP